MLTDNSEAYEALSWILENANSGFYIVTAPSHMQRELALRYKTPDIEIYDYSQNVASYSYSELDNWAESHQSTNFYFILNMQLAMYNDEDLLRFNMSRDMLAKKHKAWVFFMTRETDDRLSTFAYDIYSYVRLKARFKQEKSIEYDNPKIMTIDAPYYVEGAKEALARYKDLEEELIALSIEDTPDDRLLAAAITLSNIAELYKNIADYRNALRLLEFVKKAREKVFGTKHPDTAATYNDIGLVYHDQGDYSETLDWYMKALAIRDKVLGKEHPETATMYNNIAMVYYNQGDYSDALDWHMKALVMREKVLGTEHSDTATTYGNIALVYDSKGDYSKALDWYMKSLAIIERVLGLEHPNTATIYNNIAIVYFSQGDYSKALDWHMKALAIREKVRGKEHQDTANSYNNIAIIYDSKGDYLNALDWYLKSYKILLSKLGAEHQKTVLVKRNMKISYNMAAKYSGTINQNSSEPAEPFEEWLKKRT
jgi:tetratricopeptide (TPR) repeat protein